MARARRDAVLPGQPAAKRVESRTGHVSRESYTVPGLHAAHLAELVRRWGRSPEELLAPLGLTVEGLADPASRISVPMLERAVARARALTGEPGLGYYLGVQTRLSAHGYLGFAAMAASTIRDALDLASRFAPTRSEAISIQLEERGDRAYVIFHEHCSFGTAKDVVITSLMVGFWRIGNALTGKELKGDGEYAFPEPSYAARFMNRLPGEARFSQPSHRLVFDRKVLDLPIVMADPDALRLARHQCERELDRIGFHPALATRVRAVLGARTRALPSLAEMSHELGVSERTLRRKLAEEGTAYSELIEEVRASRAISLLRSKLTIDEIAARLGYSDSTSFTRAFRRWTGKSPRNYRSG